MSTVPKLIIQEREPLVSIVQEKDGYQKRLMRTMLVTILVFTGLAIYSLLLNNHIDSKFYLIDETKKENINLQKQVELLEAEISYLKSYGRVEKVLKDAGVQLAVPYSVFYLDLNKVDGRIARDTLNHPGKEQI